MQGVDVRDAKKTLGASLDRVERGEEIVITRHGKPVARLAASAGGMDRARAKAAADRIQARAARLQVRGCDWEALKADRGMVDDG